MFGRPSHTWSWKGYEIGSYVDYDKMIAEYTEEVTGRDLYDAIGRNILDDEDYDFTISVDGETEKQFLDDAYFTEGNLVRSNTNGVGETGNGVLTQVFVDTGAKEVYIAVINTYVAVATSDYDDRDDELDLDIYSVEDKDISRSVAFVKDVTKVANNVTVSGEDFDVADYVKDDVVLVTVADGEVQTIEDPEVLEAVTIDAFKLKSYVETDGTRYDYADSVSYDPAVLDDYDQSNLKDITYNVILDPYGYMIGIERNEDPDQYLFLVGMDTSTSNLNSRTAEANVIFMDGTVSTVDIDTRKSTANIANTELVDVATATMNTWCTYTVNSNDVYTLHEVGTALGTNDVAQSHDGTRTNIDRSHISLYTNNSSPDPVRAYGNDESVYLVVDLDMIDSATDYVITGGASNANAVIIDDVASVVTGVENADIEVWGGADVTGKYPTLGSVASLHNDENVSYGTYFLYDDEAYVIGAVVVGEDAGSTTNFVYTISTNANRESYSSADDEYTWTRPVALNGLEDEISYVGDSLDEIDNKPDLNGDHGMLAGNWYYVKYYADGTVKETTKVDNGETHGDYIVRGTMATAVQEIDVNDADHVLLNNANEGKVVFRSGTLYSEYDDSKGIWVSPDVNVVRIQYVDNDPFGEIEYYTGRDGLEDALDDLGNISGKNLEVSAIVDNGAAVVIVLNNTDPRLTDEGSENNRPSGPAQGDCQRAGPDCGCPRALWCG